MPKQLLIYEKVTPITKDRHLNYSIKAGQSYSFTQDLNSLPLMAIEFQNAALEYIIIFVKSPDSEAIMPGVIVGIQDENLYLTKQGAWQAQYIPAFVRQYPFVFASDEAGQTLTLCIDEEFSGCNQEGRGERLFDAEGEKTQYLNTVLEFLQEYQKQFQRTQIFCQRIYAMGLLEPMHASFTMPSGEQRSLDGFWGINRDRLKALTGDQLSELAVTDELELIYLHLQSIHNFSIIMNRLHENSGATEAMDNPDLS